MKTVKETVTLRSKPLNKGGKSLYLDYFIDGVRYREFLKLYLIPETDKISTIQNKETMKTALALKAKRTLDVQNGIAGFKKTSNADKLLTSYIQEVAEDFGERGHSSYAKTLLKICVHLKKFGRRLTLRTLTKEDILDFVKYLEKIPLSESTIYVYFSNINTIFNRAFRAGLIEQNPLHRLESCDKPKRPDSKREYLTVEEVTKLMKTPCPHDLTKRAFLFSCFTGLRISDVENLTWGDIRQTNSGWEVVERQVKTKKIVAIPLSDNAREQLPKRWHFKDSDKVWRALPSRSQMGHDINKWVSAAGIHKHISFHCARHTNATLLITYGVDLYTVASLLGHSDIGTTQIYAKVIDSKKVEAVAKIPHIGEI